MNADGTDKRALTKETFTLLNAPDWSPDGRFIAARKHFTTQRSLGTGEIWLYHASGGGGVSPGRAAQPAAPEGAGRAGLRARRRSIYFSRNTTPGPIFEYAQNSNEKVFAIERYDIDTGERTKVAGGPGGAVRPTPSPDGKLARLRPARGGKSQLYVKDLRSGASARSTTISTRTCRRPGRSTASIRTWTGRPTAARSCSGRAARSAASTPTAPAPPKSRSASPTPAR
jgi:Tol biopolymer transport system component